MLLEERLERLSPLQDETVNLHGCYTCSAPGHLRGYRGASLRRPPGASAVISAAAWRAQEQL